MPKNLHSIDQDSFGQTISYLGLQSAHVLLQVSHKLNEKTIQFILQLSETAIKAQRNQTTGDTELASYGVMLNARRNFLTSKNLSHIIDVAQYQRAIDENQLGARQYFPDDLGDFLGLMVSFPALVCHMYIKPTARLAAAVTVNPIRNAIGADKDSRKCQSIRLIALAKQIRSPDAPPNAVINNLNEYKKIINHLKKTRSKTLLPEALKVYQALIPYGVKARSQLSEDSTKRMKRGLST